MQFKYIATNKEGKKLTGIINAPEEIAARAQLNSLGFSILEIKKSEESTQVDPELKKYGFEALDTAGKKIKGSIPAKAPLLAYQRLIEEYHFKVQNLTPLEATPEELMAWNTEEFEKLKTEYELTQHESKKDQTMAALVESPEFVEKKKNLIDEIDSIILKIKKILTDFSEKISPDKRTTIQGYIDKLLRIKSSNNLDYIANTCKEMLEKIQAEEIFLQTQEHSHERQSLMLESQKMMMELNKVVSAKKDVRVQIKQGLLQLEQKLKNSPLAFLSSPIAGVKQWMEVPHELEMLHTQLKVIHEAEWDAFKLWIKSPKETRAAAWDEFKKLRGKEQEIKKKKRQYQRLRIESRRMIHTQRHELALREANSFTGWLLTFYLSYYFWGHYTLAQKWEIAPLLGIPYDLADSALFKYLLVLVFLFHLGTSLKINFLLRSRIANAVLPALIIGLMLMTLVNF